jgi:uncharacterized protein YyaL (SSP411 family)
MSQNLLARETSPYLRQHKDNPVHWRPWGPEAFAEAKRANKPILLSVGYAACHWCHVMAHESFENEAIASVMNELFVNIKVDREERPDVDAIYQSALALLGEHGGWPLTMFLTPNGEPFWGGTYFPASARYGRPGFPDVLKSIAETYRTAPDKVQKNVSALKDALANLAKPEGGGRLILGTLDSVAGFAIRMIDPLHGGTVGAPKFPQAAFFRFLWRAFRRTGSSLFREAVTVTLDNICQGGIYDHLGGGFARYSTDEAWLVPHFEKMLYDNALLIELMTDVWQHTKKPLYAQRVRETVAWALRDMKVGEGDGAFAFASALDADSEGEEGKYYVWREEEIDAILGADSAVFKEQYDVTPHGNWEGHTILNRDVARGLGSEALEAKLAEGRAKLLVERSKRVPPGRDDKALADWNGLMITALAHAGAAFGELAWIQHARDVFRFVAKAMSADGRLRHTWCLGEARHPAVLDDYANMSRAALMLHEVTGTRAYLAQAEAWVAVADRHYWDSASGGYFLSADDTTDVIHRAKTVHDNATPNGNGTMAEVLARLYYVTGNAAYRTRAEELMRTFTSDKVQALVGSPSLLMGYEVLESAVQTVIVGAPGDARTQALREAAFTASQPNRVLIQLPPGATLPPGHPAAGKGLVDGRPTAYVCVGPTCGLPVTEPEALRERLVGR